MTRRKVRNFASNAAKSSFATKDKEVVELKMFPKHVRQIYLLTLPVKLDPLSVVSLNLCNVGETMTTTSKSKLANHLVSLVKAG